MFFNPTYLIFMAPAFIFTMLAQFYVNATYRKWQRIPASSRISGSEAAQRLIRFENLNDVEIQTTHGKLTDHYDPRRKVLRLSQSVYQGASVASLAIAAHELGHALQDQDDYFPLRFRAMLIPAVNIGSYLGWILITVGLFLNLINVAWLGLAIISAGAIFSLATLPVELNASARAKMMLQQSGIIQTHEEERGINAVLNAPHWGSPKIIIIHFKQHYLT